MVFKQLDSYKSEFEVSYQGANLELSPDPILVSNIEKAVAKLSAHVPFSHYSLNLTDQEIAAVNNLSFNATATNIRAQIKGFNYFKTDYAQIDKFSSSFSKFLKFTSLNKENLPVIIDLVEKIFIAASANNKADETTLLEVRVDAKNPLDAQSSGYGADSQWHTDSMFQGCQQRNFITLKGPTTLFYNDQEVRKQIVEYREEHEYTKGDLLIDYSKVEKANFGQGTVFLQGLEDAALHAGPANYNEDRLVIVIDKCTSTAVAKINLDEQENLEIGLKYGGYNFAWTDEAID